MSPAPATPGTAAYKKAMRSGSRRVVTLAKIALLEPALTLYLSTRDVDTPDGQHWQAALESIGPITIPGAPFTNDVSPPSCPLTIVPRLLSRPATGDLTDLLFQNRWIGAAITVYTHELSCTAPADVFQEFEGTIQDYEFMIGRLMLRCMGNRFANRPIPPSIITPATEPHAPDTAIGLPKSIKLGLVDDIPFRPPVWGSKHPAVQGLACTTADPPSISAPPDTSLPKLIGGRRAAGAILVDTGRGSAGEKAKIVVAAHKLTSVCDFTAGLGLFLESDGRLAAVEPQPGDIFNGSKEAGCYLGDSDYYCFVNVPPSGVKEVTNSAENRRAVLDPFNDLNYARLDYAANYRELQVEFPGLSDLGTMRNVYGYIGYRCPSGSPTVGIEIINNEADPTFFNNSVGATLPITAAATAKYVQLLEGANLGKWFGGQGWTPSPWAMGSMIFRVYVGVGAGTVDVFFLGLVVQFKPRQDILLTERTVTVTKQRPLPPRFPFAKGLGRSFGPYEVQETLPATTELRGKFFANEAGAPDDGSGTFTGTASALIQRPSDMAAYLLNAYGQEPLAAIQRGAGVFGSFVDARALLKTRIQSDMICGLDISESTDVITALSWLAQSSLSWIYRSRFDGIWRMVPWKAGSGVTYDRKVSRAEMGDVSQFRASCSADALVNTNLQVTYGYDAFSKSYKHETTVGAGRSVGGQLYSNLRDAYLTVVAGVNDKLDLKRSGVAATFTLSPGSGYSWVTAQMLGLSSPGPGFHGLWWSFAFGGVVIAGVNDTFPFYWGSGSVLTITIPPGVYILEDLAAIVQAQMQTVDSTATLTYSRATGLFTFSNTRVSNPGYFDLRFQGLNSPAALFGMRPVNYNAGTTPRTWVSEFPVTEQVGLLTASATFDALWETGTNGLNGTRQNAAELLGYYGLRDSLGLSGYYGLSPKSNREAALALAAQRYGDRRTTVIEGRAIYDTETAREVLARVADLTGEPRVVVSFPSSWAFDMERGRIFQFDDVDTLGIPYPKRGSDGLWAGKSFQFYRGTKDLMRSYELMIEAIDIGP